MRLLTWLASPGLRHEDLAVQMADADWTQLDIEVHLPELEFVLLESAHTSMPKPCNPILVGLHGRRGETESTESVACNVEFWCQHQSSMFHILRAARPLYLSLLQRSSCQNGVSNTEHFSPRFQ